MLDLKAALENVKEDEKAWHAVYFRTVKSSRALPLDHPPLMRSLWEESDSAIAIGAGKASVVRLTAYQDSTLASHLSSLRELDIKPPDSPDVLEPFFTDILAYVHKHHATTRPRARLIRIFALLRPWDVTCIVWDERLHRSLAQLGVKPPRGAGLMAKHRLLIDTLWERLGKPDDLEEQIWYSILAHRLSEMEPIAGYRPELPSDDPEDPLLEEATHDPTHWLQQPAGALPLIPLADLEPHFTALARAQAFVPDDAMLPTLHAALTALPSKRFVVIGGLSGTGKTTFARLYTDALCATLGLDKPERHRRFVAVRPDWTDPTGLLGHANLLLDPPRWHRTPALTLLLDAVQDPNHPYVLILEEMNLALVEHYLAPLLTAMENPDAGLTLHGERARVDGVPPLIPWPRNLFIIGTVNMDATTHAFSDKVLDRAFIWEMNTIRVADWQALRASSPEPSPHLAVVADLLGRLYPPLEEAGRHFGYRVCDEILGFCDAAGSTEAAVLDAAIFSKVLPRLRGDDEGALSGALQAVLATCRAAGLGRCVARLERMRHALAQTGQARFWS